MINVNVIHSTKQRRDEKLMKRKILIGGIFIGVFIIILLMIEGWYLYQAMGPGSLIIGHIALAMFIICGASIFALIAYNIKVITQV